MKLSESVYRRLILLNTLAVFCAFLFLVMTLGMYRDSILSHLRPLFASVPTDKGFWKLISSGFFSKEIFSNYDLRFSNQHLQQIEQLVHELEQEQNLKDENKIWFPAKFFADGEEYNVKARLRGDLANHWQFAKKSWRVHFQGEKLFKGAKELDFIVPADKSYENEDIAYVAARKLGLLVPPAGFTNLSINSLSMGMYFWMETPSAQMLEKLRYEQGEIFHDQNAWTQGEHTGYGLPHSEYHFLPSNYSATFLKDAGKSERLLHWTQFLNLVRLGSDKDFESKIEHFINVEKYLQWNALTWLFGSLHSHASDNVKWYLDPTHGLLEPILYDVGRYPIANEGSGSFEVHENSPLALRLLRISKFQQQRNKILYQILKDSEFNLANRANDRFATLWRPLLATRFAPSIWGFFAYHQETVKILEDNRKKLLGNLEFGRVFIEPILHNTQYSHQLILKIVPDSLAALNFRGVTFRPSIPDAIHFDRSRWTLHNSNGTQIKSGPLQVAYLTAGIQAQFEDETLVTPLSPTLSPVGKEWTLTFDLKYKTPPSSKTLLSDFDDLSFNVVHSLTRSSLSKHYIHTANIHFDGKSLDGRDEQFEVPGGNTSLGSLPFVHNGNHLRLKAGSYSLKSDLFLPPQYELVLEAGVTLRLGPGVRIVLHQPLTVNGTQASPVRILPLVPGSPWGSIGVLRAPSASHLSYLIVEGGGGSQIGSLYLSGQLSFHDSEVHLSDCTIRNAQSDDAINIKHAKYSVNRCLFEDNKSDALDADWTKGTVTDSRFIHNGGDGLDLSGSEVVVTGTLFKRMKDKGISVGEKTKLLAIDNIFSGNEIGVASKDLSTSQIFAGTFHKNRVGISVYQKKHVFGPGFAYALSSIFLQNDRDFQVDGSSRISLTSVALQRWNEKPGVQTEDLRIGKVSSCYHLSESDKLIFNPSSASCSPFVTGVRHQEQGTFLGRETPDMSNGPIGFYKPTQVTR